MIDMRDIFSNPEEFYSKMEESFSKPPEDLCREHFARWCLRNENNYIIEGEFEVVKEQKQLE